MELDTNFPFFFSFIGVSGVRSHYKEPGPRCGGAGVTRFLVWVLTDHAGGIGVFPVLCGGDCFIAKFAVVDIQSA